MIPMSLLLAPHPFESHRLFPPFPLRDDKTPRGDLETREILSLSPGSIAPLRRKGGSAYHTTGMGAAQCLHLSSVGGFLYQSNRSTIGAEWPGAGQHPLFALAKRRGGRRDEARGGLFVEKMRGRAGENQPEDVRKAGENKELEVCHG